MLESTKKLTYNVDLPSLIGSDTVIDKKKLLK